MAEGFTCWAVMDLMDRYPSACADLPEYQAGLCALHYAGGGKEDAFKDALESKLAQKNYNFRGTIFPEGT